MKKRTLILVLLVVGSITFSCSKEEETIKNEAVANNGLINIGDTIFLGVEENMIVTPVNFDLYPPNPRNSSKTYPIDINIDGVDDFSLTTQMFNSPGSSSCYSSINSLNSNSFIASFNKSDTLFLNLDTVNFIINFNYTCERLKNADSIFNINPNQSKIVPFELNEKLMNSSNFNSSSITLFNCSSDSPESYYPPYTHRIHYLNDCDLLPLNSIQYIGIKLDDGFGYVKLGWIKINHTSSTRINIIEYAIQV